jgi:ATP-binding cassette subfamily B protein
MKLSSPIPTNIQSQLSSLLLPEEKILFSVKSDLTRIQKFGNTWLCATASTLIVCDDTNIIQTLMLSDITEVEVEELFGASRLVAKTDLKTIPVIWYSRAFVPEFGVFCRVINQLIKGIEPQLPEEEEPAYCPKCGKPLPERGGTCLRCLPRFLIFNRLLELCIPFKSKLFWLIGVTALTVGTQMIAPYVTKRIVDDVIKGGQGEMLVPWISIMVGSGFLYLLARFTAGFISTWLAARMVSDLRARLHETVQRLTLGYFNRRGSGELVSRIMHDTEELQHFLIDGMPYLLINSVSFISITVILIRLDARLALLVFLPVPFLIFGANWFWKRLRPMFHKRGSTVGAMHSILAESIAGIKVVKAFTRESDRSQQFNKINERLFNLRYNIDRTFTGFQEVMFWIMQLGVSAIWFFAAWRISHNDPTLTLGTLLAFVGYIWLLYGPLQWFTAVLNWMTHAFASAERIFTVLDTRAEVYEAPSSVTMPIVRGNVTFNDVRFSYERGKEVIRGISFDIAAGEMIGLVGKSGAGKSTIINLICRFFDADSGMVSIDGHDIRTINLRDVRSHIGIVMQEPFLFNTSIMENIRYGKPTATFEEVVRAARAAWAHDFILDKEDGYDTVIGEHGVMLSGGEKQRISIARAILHDPPILILDEATSSVDSETEKHIQEAIATLVKGRTTIAIAHRLATLRNAHRLFVIEDGNIVEQGTHDELMVHNGAYAKLVSMQTEINRIRAEVWKE